MNNERNELVAQATQLGIAKASNLKSSALKEMIAEKMGVNAGEPKPETRGRKVNPESARQKRLAAKEQNGPAQRGRKPNPNSARQARLEKWDSMKLRGLEVKRGRPKMEKVKAVYVAAENNDVVNN